MRTLRTLFFAGLLIQATASFAWGPEGHKIVAEIAKNQLAKNIQDSVQKYLGSTTFEEAAVWMDEMRRDPAYDYMKPWHYVNIDKDKTYVMTKDWDVINTLEKVIEQLKNRKQQSYSDTNVHLKVLFHLVGDIQQPLHVGYGNDRGGNDVKLTFLNKPSNLHRVWDEDIIVAKGITLKTCLDLIPGLTDPEKKQAKDTNVLSWVNEGRALLPQVYDFKDNTITQDYVDKNGIVVEKQLLLAGMRLAAVLNEVFKK